MRALHIWAVSVIWLCCSACASISGKPDLRRNAGELFDSLEKEPGESQPGISSRPRSPSPEVTAGRQTFKFEETGRWMMSKAETPGYAESQAENDALAKALRLSGAETYYGFSDVRGELNGAESGAVASYLQVWSKGVVEWERIGKPEFSTTAAGVTCTVRIKGTVTFRGEPDPAFDIKLHAGARELGLSRTVIKAGEAVEFSAMLTKEAYLQVVSVDQEQNVYLIYPNAYSNGGKFPAGEVFKFPQAGSGLELKAALPPGAALATEAIHVIATKNTPLFTEAEYSAGPLGQSHPAGKLKEIMGKLAKMKRSEWTMAVLPYQITN